MSSSKPIPINQTTFRILYFKYKPYFISVGVMIVCLFVFLEVIIPQIQTWFSIRDQIAQEQQKLTVLNQNLSVITKIDAKTLDTDTQAVSTALPSNKDFAAVLGAISNAAIIANVGLGDYSFTVGNLSSVATADNNLQLTLTINGGIDDVRRFILALKSQLPLSDVTDVKINSVRSSTLIVVFYIKPFPKFTFSTSTPLVGISGQDVITISQLKVSLPLTQASPFVGTASAR